MEEDLITKATDTKIKVLKVDEINKIGRNAQAKKNSGNAGNYNYILDHTEHLCQTLLRSEKMISCCVATCKNTSISHSMHSFPNNKENLDRYNTWIRQLGREDLREKAEESVLKSYHVCEVHFSNEQTFPIDNNKTDLKATAIPDINLPLPLVKLEKNQENAVEVLTKLEPDSEESEMEEDLKTEATDTKIKILKAEDINKIWQNTQAKENSSNAANHNNNTQYHEDIDKSTKMIIAADKVRKHKCNRCPAYFPTKPELVNHRELKNHSKHPIQRVHHGLHICKRCNAKFPSKIQLKVHRKTHREESSYGCTDCGKKYITKWRYDLHMETIHADGQPYKCDVCIIIASSKDISLHQIVHNNKEMFNCEFCRNRLETKMQWQRHLRRHHQSLRNKYFGVAGYRPCMSCPSSFAKPLLGLVDQKESYDTTI